METLECIKNRRSIRKFQDKALPWDYVCTVVNAGIFAPSSGNLQNWKFVIVKELANRKKLAEAALDQKWMEIAPIHIVVCADPQKAERFYGVRGQRLYTIQNCAAAVENMLLAATDMGIGACWVGAFDENKVRRVINAPETIQIHSIVVLGCPDEEPKMQPKSRIEHVAFIERYWGRIKTPVRGYYSDKIKETVTRSKEAIERLRKKIDK